MVRGPARASLIEGTGAVFVMNMYNATMGDLQVANHVVVYEPDKAIGWHRLSRVPHPPVIRGSGDWFRSARTVRRSP